MTPIFQMPADNTVSEVNVETMKPSEFLEKFDIKADDLDLDNLNFDDP